MTHLWQLWQLLLAYATLVSLYYALVYPYFTYSLIAWGHTYKTIINPLIVLQKRAIRIITFSSYCDHSSPLFKYLNLIKLQDLVNICTAVLMFKFHNSLLPSIHLTSFLCLLTNYIIIIQGYHLTNLILFLNEEQIMVCLILDFKGLKYGILLIVKSRPHLWLF